MKYHRKIAGERLYLSPMSAEDVELYTEWMNDSDLTDKLGTSTQIYTLEKERDVVEGMMREGYNFAIIRVEDNQLIGNISLFEINQIHRKAICGLFIGDEGNRNRGYGQEALRLLLSFAFNTLNINNVMLKVFSFNQAALACYKKVGFKVIGERRESYFVNGKYYNEILMDILSDEFN